MLLEVKMPTGTYPRKSPEERFHESYIIDADTGCWLWIGTIGSYGYGHFYANKKLHRAHRYSWELKNGPIPKGLLVCHHCDKPPCVNPSHLFVGTQMENIHDAMRKGRIRDYSGKGCLVERCKEKHYSKGYCQEHYVRVRKYGNPDINFPARSKGEKLYKPNNEIAENSVNAMEMSAEAEGWKMLGYGDDDNYVCDLRMEE